MLEQKGRSFTPKNAKIFNCDKCNFKCSKQSDWDRHVMTRKHQNRTNLNILEQKTPKNANYFYCECGKIYNARNSYWYHRKVCYMNEKNNNNIILDSDTRHVDNDNSSEIDKELLVKMMLQNQEVMQNIILQNKDVMTKMMEIMPHVGNTVNNTLTNSNNTNHFNIQMFLNEHCKNAMNLTDFIESLPITAETYDNTLENGLTKSMTHLITNGLSQLDVLERPIHCMDTARKILYIKENNAWEKDNELLTLIEGIQKIIFKQRTMLKKWQNVNEGWDTNELLQEKMTRLVFHSMMDVGNDEKEMGKIIRAISKNVYLDNDTKSKYL